MLQVRVLYDGVFTEITGCHEEAVACPGDSLGHLVEALSARHGQRFRESVLDPDTREVTVSTSVLVNGSRKGLTDPLVDGDEVVFLMPFPGG